MDMPISTITQVSGIVKSIGNTSLTDDKITKKLVKQPMWIKSLWNGINKWLILWENDNSEIFSFEPLTNTIGIFEKTIANFGSNTYLTTANTKNKLARAEWDDNICYFSELNGSNKISMSFDEKTQNFSYYSKNNESLIISFSSWLESVDDKFLTSKINLKHKINAVEKSVEILNTGDIDFSKYTYFYTIKVDNEFHTIAINNFYNQKEVHCFVIKYNHITDLTSFSKSVFTFDSTETGRCFLQDGVSKAIKISSDLMNIVKIENDKTEKILFNSLTEIEMLSVFINGDYVYKTESKWYNSENKLIANINGNVNIYDYTKNIEIDDFEYEENIPSTINIEKIFVGELLQFTTDGDTPVMVLSSNSENLYKTFISNSESYRQETDRYIPSLNENDNTYTCFPLYIQFDKYIPRHFRNKYRTEILNSIELSDDNQIFKNDNVYYVDIDGKTTMIIVYISEVIIDPYGGGNPT